MSEEGGKGWKLFFSGECFERIAILQLNSAMQAYYIYITQLCSDRGGGGAGRGGGGG